MQIFSQLNINLAIIMIFRASVSAVREPKSRRRTISYTLWSVSISALVRSSIVHQLPSPSDGNASQLQDLQRERERARKETWRNVSCTRANKLKCSRSFSSARWCCCCFYQSRFSTHRTTSQGNKTSSSVFMESMLDESREGGLIYGVAFEAFESHKTLNNIMGFDLTNWVHWKVSKRVQQVAFFLRRKGWREAGEFAGQE